MMMSTEKQTASKWLHIRLKPKEYDKIYEQFTASTCRKLSEFARRVLLDKPLTVNHRNQSLDDFMAEWILLRNDLNAIGNNFNQMVKRLHTLDQVSEFKSWLRESEAQRSRIEEQVKMIKNQMNQISDKWLQ